jgi:hypothetical protein
MAKQVQSMNDAINELLLYLLNQFAIKRQDRRNYQFAVNDTGAIQVRITGVDYDEPRLFNRPDLIGIVLAYNYIVYGR